MKSTTIAEEKPYPRVLVVDFYENGSARLSLRAPIGGDAIELTPEQVQALRSALERETKRDD